jgi:hypothetical protein
MAEFSVGDRVHDGRTNHNPMQLILAQQNPWYKGGPILKVPPDLMVQAVLIALIELPGPCHR